MILDVNAAKEAAMRAHKCADMLLEAMETIDARDKKIEMLMEIVDDKEKEITTIKSAINTDIKQEELREEIRRLNEEITRLEKEIDKSNEYRKASIEVMAEILKERDDRMNDRNRKQD